MREVCEVCEFHVNKDNKPESNIIYRKNIDGTEILNSPSPYLIDYLEGQGIDLANKNFDNLKIDLPFNNQVDTTSQGSNNTSVNTNINADTNVNQNMNNTVTNNVTNTVSNDVVNNTNNTVNNHNINNNVNNSTDTLLVDEPTLSTQSNVATNVVNQNNINNNPIIDNDEIL